jgi:hypothetical protein
VHAFVPAPPPAEEVPAPPTEAVPAPPTEAVPEELATAAASRPVPTAPEAEPARFRKRWPWVAALAVLALAGAGAGVWAGQQHGTPVRAAPPTATSAAPAYQLYFLPVVATAPRPGTVRLEFADASTLPGFDSYVVFRDQTRIDQIQAPPYLLQGVDRSTKHCYAVAALVVTDQPTPPAPKPACLTA